MPRLDAAACAALMTELIGIAAQAAEAILNSSGKADPRLKADGSPVTDADEAAEAVICDGLARLAPDLLVISEEHAARDGPNIPPVGASYFLIDPLDGTREFIAGRDEYAINIALMTDGAPLLGIICAPARGVCWRGIASRGAERLALSGGKIAPADPIRARPRRVRSPVVMVSRSHLDPHTRAFADRLPQAELVPCGSAIKFCRVAEGSADLYPRLAPTRDWDVAAGHAIVKAAGGEVTAPDGAPLAYGTANLLIPGFVASGRATA